MKINKDMIKTFNPCDPGYKNYLTHYSDFNGSFDEFLDLEHIPYADKLWLGKKMLNKKQVVHWYVLCTESVLYIYENKFPGDTKVRNYINHLKTIDDFSNLTEVEKKELIDAGGAMDDLMSCVDAYYDTDSDARIKQENLNLQFLKMVASL